jgi:tetratricopeptide (TPR) repeat protein
LPKQNDKLGEIHLRNQNNRLIDALNLHKKNDLKNAEIAYKLFLKKAPNDDIALHYYGLLCKQTGRYNEAIELLLKVIKIKKNSQCFIDLAQIYFEIGMKEEALSLYKEMIKHFPDNPSLLYEIGLLFYNEKLFDDAINTLTLAHKFEPDDLNTNKILGLLLHNKGDNEKAQIHYEKALIAAPNDPLLQHDLALIYYGKKDFKKAVECFEKASTLAPDNSAYLLDVATVYNEIRNFEKAIEFYIKAIESDPTNGRTYYLLGCALLTIGDFDKGWLYFDEARIKIFNHHVLRLPEDKYPKWRGENISGKTLYVFGVAGHGDSVLFARYLPILHEMGIKVKCKPQKLLHRLFEQSDLKVELVQENVPESEIECDYQIPMMSLGRVFNSNFDTMPSKNGYLKPNPQKTEYFKQKYFNNNDFKVGIVWASNGFDKERSVPLELFLPIKDIPNVKLYSFQAGGVEKRPGNIPEDYGIINPASEFDTFAEAADAMSNLDLLISVCTATIHVAGAIGLNAWAVIPHSAYWGWATNTDKSYLYNSVSLFRQTSNDNWSEIMQDVIESLKNEAANLVKI